MYEAAEFIRRVCPSLPYSNLKCLQSLHCAVSDPILEGRSPRIQHHLPQALASCNGQNPQTLRRADATVVAIRPRKVKSSTCICESCTSSRSSLSPTISIETKSAPEDKVATDLILGRMLRRWDCPVNRFANGPQHFVADGNLCAKM